MLDDGRGLVLFVHDAGMQVDSWSSWLALFDRNGYDGIVLRGPEELPATDRPPIIVGHGVGGPVAHRLSGRSEVAAAIVLAPVRRRPAGWRRPAAVPHGPAGRPMLLVSGTQARRAAERLRRERRRSQPAAVTDHVHVKTAAALVDGAGWEVVANLCLDWLTGLNL